MTEPLTPSDGEALLRLARAAIEDRLVGPGALLRAREAIALTPGLHALRGCFVTLHAVEAGGRRQLRGCIGSTEARLPAHDAVVASAVDAAFADPRFSPLTGAELAGVVVSVSMLTPIAAVPSADAIVAGRDGVVLAYDGRSALFLPEVAVDHGWTVEQLLSQLSRKAGLPGHAWRRARLSTFRTERFGETAWEADRIPRP